MKVGEFRRKYGITPLYAVDRGLLNKYYAAEVVAYAVTMAKGKAFSYVFIYNTGKNLRAFLNGRHVLVETALSVIETAHFEKRDLPKSLFKDVVMRNI